VEASLTSEIKTPRLPLPDKLRGPNSAIEPREPHEAYSGAANLLPIKALPQRVRVYLGEGLVKAFVKDKDLEPEFSEQLEKIRDQLARQFGVDLPAVRFKDPDFDPGIADNTLRIEMFTQEKQDTEGIKADQGKPLEALSTALLFNGQSFRSHFLTADSVFRDLRDMKPRVRQWLLAKYSLTDLKLLLRGVINPTAEEQKNWEQAQKAGKLEKAFLVAPEQSIRQPA
jgi:hypothetical protein